MRKTKTAPALLFPEAYPAVHVTIDEKKVCDLKKLKDYVVGYGIFYNEIFNWPTMNCNAAATLAPDIEGE